MIKNYEFKKIMRYFPCYLFLLAFLVPSWAWAEEQIEMPTQCDNAHFLKDRALNENNFKKFYNMRVISQDYPEHICGVVAKVFRAKKTKSGWHGYFLLSLNGQKIKIISNLDEIAGAPSWPWVRVGEQVEVQGRYYYDSPQKQGIDWTHHGTSRKWACPGFVMVGTQKYQ